MDTGIFFFKFSKQCGLAPVAWLTTFNTGNHVRITSRQSGRNDHLKTNLTRVPSSLPLPLFLLIFSRSLPSRELHYPNAWNKLKKCCSQGLVFSIVDHRSLLLRGHNKLCHSFALSSCFLNPWQFSNWSRRWNNLLWLENVIFTELGVSSTSIPNLVRPRISSFKKPKEAWLKVEANHPGIYLAQFWTKTANNWGLCADQCFVA